MRIKYIKIKEGMHPIRIECSDNHTYYGDTSVTIYDDCKISLVLSDDCGAVIGDKIFFPKRGDIMIFRPEEVHFGRFPQRAAYQFISVFFPVNLFSEIFPQSEELMAPFCDQEPEKLNLLTLANPYRMQIIELAEDILEIMNVFGNNLQYDVLLFAKLIEVLDICRKCYFSQRSNPYISPIPKMVRKTMEAIDNAFPASLSLTELAKICGCSTTYLTTMFKKYTGKSIHSYLTERRLEQARSMLARGYSVTEACYQSGFSDCSRFIVMFKKKYHTTPGNYKRGQQDV